MIERAPSGRYVEEWQLVPGSRDGLDGTSSLPMAGSCSSPGRWRRSSATVRVAFARRRSTCSIAGRSADRARIRGVLDCEFSVALQGDDGVHRIAASTLPWREGGLLDAPV